MTDSWSPDFGLLQMQRYFNDESERRRHYHSPVFDGLKLGAGVHEPRHPITIRPETVARCAARVRQSKMARVFRA